MKSTFLCFKAGMALSLGLLLATMFTSCQKRDIATPDETQPSSASAKKYKSTSIPFSSIDYGLIGYWPLDNGSGNDASGNNNNATLNGTTSTTDRFGNANSALYFNGSSDYLTVADNAALRLNNTDFTLNAWVKLDSYNNSYNSAIFSKRLTGYDNGWLWDIKGNSSYTTGTIIYGPGGGSTNASGNTVVGLSSWHMVTSVYSLSSQQLSIYVDGVLDNSTSGISTANAYVATALYIGRDNPDTNTNGYFFEGAMDDLRIYNRALASSEIQELFNAVQPPSGSLIAYWTFDYGTGYDFTGHGHTATYNGSNLFTVTDRIGNGAGAVYFDGSSDYWTVPDDISLRLNNTDFTLNAWVKLDSYNSSYNSAVLSKRLSGYDNGWLWGIKGNSSYLTGTMIYGPGGGNANASGNAVVGLSNWHMVTSVYSLSSQQLSIYVDGVLDSVTGGILTSNGNISETLYIGKDNPGTNTNGYYFQGAMDDVRIYSRALSSTEVQQLFNTIY